jgi:hypothetical protein
MLLDEVHRLRIAQRTDKNERTSTTHKSNDIIGLVEENEPCEALPVAGMNLLPSSTSSSLSDGNVAAADLVDEYIQLPPGNENRSSEYGDSVAKDQQQQQLRVVIPGIDKLSSSPMKAEYSFESAEGLTLIKESELRNLQNEIDRLKERGTTHQYIFRGHSRFALFQFVVYLYDLCST